MKMYSLDSIPGISPGRLKVGVSSFWFISNKLFLDGQEIPKHEGRYYIKNEFGEEHVIKLNRIGYDLIPQVSLNGSANKPVLAAPFTIFENIWCILPFFNVVILFSFGSLLLCSLSVFINIKLMRAYKNKKSRFVLTFLINFIVTLLLIKIRRILGLPDFI